MEPVDDNIRRLCARLCEQAVLFDSPETYVAGLEDALAAVVRLPGSATDPVLARFSAASWQHDHLVSFYESDEFLVDSISQFLTPALRAGEAAIIVATGQHREQFEAALTTEGLNATAAGENAQLVALDAAQTLSAFLVDGTPDPARFRSVLGELIDGVAANGRVVRIYGEMVALLFEEGNVPAAVMLEDLWNELADSHPFSLLCAYPVGAFHREESTAAFRTLCQQHSAVIPSESYSKLSDPDDRLRAVALLQQEARAGIHERMVLRRKQDELQAEVGRLRDLDRRIEFVATLVHDMQTPAAIISESLGLLRERWSKLDEDEIHEFLITGIENIKQIERHVGDLLLALWFSDFLLE